MSATPPQSPLKSLSTVDYLDASEQPSREDDNLLSEADADENLHIGEDPLADRLDYEADELHEQEELSNIGKTSPVNEKELLFQDFDTYDPDDKKEFQSSFETSHESLENNFTETSTKSISDANVTENVNVNESSNLFDTKSSEVPNKNESIGRDSSDDGLLDIDSGIKKDTEEKDGCADKTTIDQATKSIENICHEELEEGEVSDEDEEARKERLKPQPVCRFYSKGACTWGSSCRFIHPGVMDTGR